MNTFSSLATTVGLCFSQGKGGKHGFGNVGEDYQARIENIICRISVFSIEYRCLIREMVSPALLCHK